MPNKNASILKAAKIADKVFNSILSEIKPGVSEIEIANKIKYYLRKYGAKKPSFRIIVASGKRSAKPHGFATDKIIKKGDLVVIDFGALYNSYRSDITRTIILGKPSKSQKKAYQIVTKAHSLAVQQLKAGQMVKKIDLAARNFISKCGYEKNFIHTTGHGIGKKVHQAPKISKKNVNLLKNGDIVCIEPGIYVKNWGGIRIEDMYLITNNGANKITKTERVFKL